MSTSTTPIRSVDHDRGPPPSHAAPFRDDELFWRDAEGQLAGTAQRPTSPGATRHFVRHFIEMVLAMMVGMMALGALDSAILSAAGTSVQHVRNSAPEVFALVMALNMTIGMTVWMRYRGHSWAMCAEMGGAMFAPAILAIVLFRLGVIDGPAAGGVLMGAMFPAMIAVMLFRRTEYSQPVHAHSGGGLRSLVLKGR